MCRFTDSTEAKSKQHCSPGSSKVLLRLDYIFGPDNLPLLYSLASDFDLLVCPHSRYVDVVYACTYIRLHTITLAHTIRACTPSNAPSHARTHVRACVRAFVRACTRVNMRVRTLSRALHRVVFATKDLPTYRQRIILNTE